MRTARQVLAHIARVEREAPPLIHRIQRATIQLALMSHVSASPPPLPPTHAAAAQTVGWRVRATQRVTIPGAHPQRVASSRIPVNSASEHPRTIQERLDLRDHYLACTPLALSRRVNHATRIEHLQQIAADAEAAVRAWRQTPLTPDHPVALKRTDPLWKRHVAASALPASELARRYAVTARHIRRIRAQYTDHQP